MSDQNTTQFRSASQAAGSNVRIHGTLTLDFTPLNDWKIVSAWNNGTPTDRTTFVLGRDRNQGSRVWTGGIAEVVVYQEILSTAEIQQIEEYLRNKYLPALTLGWE